MAPRLLTLFSVLLASCSLVSAASPSSIRHPHMGVQTHFGHGGPVTGSHWKHQSWDIGKTMPLIAELGVGWIRDEIFWNQYETEKGNYALPPRAREWIEAAHAANLKIILILNTDKNNIQKLYSDPYDPEAYARAAANLARELRGKIHAIEILNEPNNFGFMQHYGGNWNGWDRKTGKENEWIAAYVNLINTAAPAIRQANPEIKIIGLGSPTPANYRKIARGLAREIDGITDHPYTFRSNPEVFPIIGDAANLKRDGILVADGRATFASMIRMYREHSAKHNGPRELWLTEWGFPTHFEAKRAWYSGRTPEAQSKYSLRRYAECLGLDVEMSVIYDFKDDGRDIYEAEDNFGIMTYDLTPKPAYSAIRNFARFMIDWRATKKISRVDIEVMLPDTRPAQWPLKSGLVPVDTDTVKAYAFEPVAEGSRKLMLLAWSVERSAELSPRVGDIEIQWPRGTPLPKAIRLYDLATGHVQDSPEMTFLPSNRLKLARISVPDSPIALVFE